MNEIEILNFAVNNGILEIGDIRSKMQMKEKQKFLDMHSGKIWQGENGYWYTRLPERKLIKKRRKEDLQEAIITYYRGHDDTPTLQLVFEQWVEWKLQHREIGNGTRDRYRTEFRRFIGGNEIARRDIREITESELEYFIKEAIIDQELTAKAYGNMRTLINGIFRHAKHEGLTQISISSFFGDLTLSRKAFTKTQKKTQIFYEDEIPKIIQWLRENPSVENYGIILAFYTGIREGELAALKYSDIRGNIMHVQRQEIKYKLGAGKMAHDIVDYTKTEAGDREIILPQQALAIVEAIRRMNPSNDFLMAAGDRLIHTNTFNDRLYKACDALGIERRSMHKIRKTYGTTLLDSGADESLIMTQMGHRDIATTRKYYYFSNKNCEHKTEQIQKAIAF